MDKYFFERFEELRAKTDYWIDEYLGLSSRNALLDEACRYSLVAPGKRLRPVLALEVCSILGLPLLKVRSFALALELIHTASLIHDDLPGLDNDNLRRGRPTCHKVFGEGPALLAGDELIAKAIALVAEDAEISAQMKVGLISLLCEALSHVNYGQTLDLQLGGGVGEGLRNDSFRSQAESAKLDILLDCYFNKTAYLVGVSVAGAVLLDSAEGLNGRNSPIFNELFSFGVALGVAFQVTDDLLSYRSTSEESGKNVGSERDGEKLTVPSLIGFERAMRLVDDHCAEAISALSQLPDRLNVDFLLDLCEWIRDRRA